MFFVFDFLESAWSLEKHRSIKKYSFPVFMET